MTTTELKKLQSKVARQVRLIGFAQGDDWQDVSRASNGTLNGCHDDIILDHKDTTVGHKMSANIILHTEINRF